MKKRFFALFLYLIVILACIVMIYIVPSISSMLEKTYVAEKGTIEVTRTVDAVIVRNETVYVAGKAGTVTQIVDDGTLVKADTSIIKISGEGSEEISSKYWTIVETLGSGVTTTKNGVSKSIGFVSYSVDGAEAALTYDNIAELTRSEIETYGAMTLLATATEACAIGEPVCKVTDNGDWYLVFYADIEDASLYKAGSTIKITIGDTTVRAYIDSVTEVEIEKTKEQELEEEESTDETSDDVESTEDADSEEDAEPTTELKIVLGCKTQIDGYLTMRSESVKITFSSATGLLIYDESIVTKDDVKGVLVKNKLGNNVFVRISVKADNGEQSAVYETIFMDAEGNYVETIDVYDEILWYPTDEDVENAG